MLTKNRNFYQKSKILTKKTKIDKKKIENFAKIETFCISNSSPISDSFL